MIEVMINGKKEFCYLVRGGEVNNIVVPLNALSPLDQKRFAEMDSSGSDLMTTMRDTKLDNGTNALVLYQELFVTVPVNKPKPAPVTENTQESAETVEIKAPAPKKKRGRGRPKKNA